MRASGITLTCPDTGPVAGGSWMGSGTGWSREPAEWRRMTEYEIRNMGITSVWSVMKTDWQEYNKQFVRE